MLLPGCQRQRLHKSPCCLLHSTLDHGCPMGDCISLRCPMLGPLVLQATPLLHRAQRGMHVPLTAAAVPQQCRKKLRYHLSATQDQA